MLISSLKNKIFNLDSNSGSQFLCHVHISLPGLPSNHAIVGQAWLSEVGSATSRFLLGTSFFLSFPFLNPTQMSVHSVLLWRFVCVSAIPGPWCVYLLIIPLGIRSTLMNTFKLCSWSNLSLNLVNTGTRASTYEFERNANWYRNCANYAHICV